MEEQGQVQAGEGKPWRARSITQALRSLLPPPQAGAGSPGQHRCLACLMNTATTGNGASPPGKGGTCAQAPAEGLGGVPGAP